MTWICGVEEAGRGPVIGPMLMACCWVEAKNEHLLVEAGVKDSKQLTPQQRVGALERLAALRKNGVIGYTHVTLSPQEIDEAVLAENDNLNKLEARTTVQLIKNALENAAVKKALIDCPTKNTSKYQKELADELPKTLKVVAENKADENYPVVSAASIIAKVTRDERIEELKKQYNKNFGSGYPADPLTKDFLQKNYNKKEYDELFRKSWVSHQRLVEAGKQKPLFHYAKERETVEARESKHAATIKAFEALRAHGYDFVEPKTEYEVVRLQGRGATIVKYTTGKLLVQGSGEAKKIAEAILEKKKLF